MSWKVESRITWAGAYVRDENSIPGTYVFCVAESTLGILPSTGTTPLIVLQGKLIWLVHRYEMCVYVTYVLRSDARWAKY